LKSARAEEGSVFTNQTALCPSGSERTKGAMLMDVYAIVTEKIVNLLESGIVPWRKPWTSTGLPRNLVSKKPYKGVNYFLLSATKYLSPFWLTYRQAAELGGHVRKGEESTIVIFWKVEDSKPSNEDLEVEETNDKNRRRFLFRFYRVFNLEQCELPQAVLDKLPKIETHEHDPIEAAERIIAGIPNPPEIQYASSRAFYSPITDRITLPPRELFSSAEEFYATLNHEESHAVGHPKRLNRKSIAEAASFGSPVYAAEELIAELSAAYLCAEAGISPAVIENEAAYLQGWLAKLRSDKRLIVIAAAKAQKAADYILGRFCPD
jgi:antirestriction protein ArdC